MRKPFLSLVACLISFLSSCSEGDPPDGATKAAAPSPTAAPVDARVVDACSLLTSEEIESILGEQPRAMTPQMPQSSGELISQCYFALPTASNSISLRVLQGGTEPGARKAKPLWAETFSKGTSLMRGTGKTGAPRKIDGLGEEAFWVGNDIIGALSVLEGDRYVTISVGGAGGESAKIEKCSAIARIVLSRL